MVPTIGTIKGNCCDTILAVAGKPFRAHIEEIEEPVFEYRCFVDGAWSAGWKGGLGYVFFHKGELL